MTQKLMYVIIALTVMSFIVSLTNGFDLSDLLNDLTIVGLAVTNILQQKEK
ncbi:hypothetical protein [Streptococcus hyointestinalis]|uniref:hypothetical protein n=1 Tax=Streptococcus hyointestinalis TaxID=1337 RepID=UPI0013E01135|nr:hypothetical protein [Streptococcus hyointestinalis]